MREIEIEKMVINCGGIGEKLERSVKLIEMMTNRKVCKIKSKKRIPAFGISPGKESGCKVTIRDKEKIDDLLKKFFAALDNKLSAKNITANHVSFGIREYVEVPGLEYKREIGILGFEVSIVFTRKGKRVKIRKIKQGRYPKKQDIAREEMINFLIKHYNLAMGEQ